MLRLLEALQRQLRLNERKNLLHAEVGRVLAIDPVFLACLEEALADPRAAPDARSLGEMAASAAAALIERVYEVNQFLQVPLPARRALEAVYRSTWERIAVSGDIESVLRGWHYPQLGAWLGGLYPRPLERALRAQETLGAVPCQHYAPELQLRLLRLRPSALLQPVLDVGCGPDALLVGWLRARGIDAHGLDRSLRARGPHLQEGDWLESSCQEGRWGTILSHMGFTNHFAYALRYEPAKALRYRRKYLQLLEALRPGGSFLYAPAAPPLEQAAEAGGFSVECWSVAYGYGAARVTRPRR